MQPQQDERTNTTEIKVDSSAIEFLIKNTLRSPKFWKYSGRLLTGAFVAPAGFYSALFVDKLAKDINPAIRLIPDAIAGFTATAGKYALMNNLNEEAFKGLAQVNWRQTFTSRELYTFKNMMIYALTLSVCSTFAYLGLVSLYETAALSEEYHTEDGNRFAKFISSYPIQAIVASASVFCNLLTFQHIIPGSFAQLQSFLLGSMASTHAQQSYLSEQIKLTHTANTLVSDFNELITVLKRVDESEPDYQSLYRLVQQIVDRTVEHGLEDTPKNKLRDLLQNHYMQNQQVMITTAEIKSNLLRCAPISTQPPSVTRARFSSLATLLVVTVTTMGLTNFWDIANDLGKELGLGQYALIVGISSMISIALLGATTLNLKPFIDGSFQPILNKKTIRIVNDNTRWLLNVSAHFICLAGGTANGYQSLALAHQSYPLIAASILSSYLLELNGTIKLFQSSAEKTELKKLSGRCDFIEELNHLAQQVISIDATPPTLSESVKIRLRFPFMANIGGKLNPSLITPILPQEEVGVNPMRNDMVHFSSNA